MIMSKPSITELEKHFIGKAMEASDIGVGPFIEQFENLWANKNGMTYGVSCNSGTNAIFLALKALGIGKGDEVILPEFTMVATSWAVCYTGAVPVYVDCTDDLLMDVTKIKVTPKTKAIITVPIYGRRAAVPKLGIPIIEDMAEGHGIKPEGDIACYSFYGNKILTTGEGGMCLTNNSTWANEMRLYANMYFDKNRSYLHPKMGYNFRMTNLQAAVGLAQVMRMDEILEKRKQVEAWYDQNLPEHVKMPPRDVIWFYDIQTDHQEELKAYLEAKDIPSRYGFKPMSMQPTSLGEYEHLNAYKWSKRVLYLPTWTDMPETDVQKVCQAISSFEKR